MDWFRDFGIDYNSKSKYAKYNLFDILFTKLEML